MAGVTTAAPETPAIAERKPCGPARLVVMFATLLGFGLRAYGLGIQPLWGDEGWSFYFARMPLADMLNLTARDIHPPLYYALLHGWLTITGGSPEAARLLSVVIGTSIVPAAYRLAAHLFGRHAGLAVAMVVAIAPLAVYYAQEVRMYGLVTLLGLASVYCFARLLSGNASRGLPAAYAFATAAALYTMYYAVFVVLAQITWLVAWWLAQRGAWSRIRRAGLVLLAAGLLYLPWVVYAGGRLATYVQGKRTAEGYLPLEPARYLSAHLVAFSVGHLSEALAPLALAALLFALLATLALVRRPQPRAPGARLLLLYLLVPVAGGYLVNLIYPFTPRYFERTLLLAAPAWWMLTGAGLAWLWQRSRTAVPPVPRAVCGPHSAGGMVLAGFSALLLAVNVVGLFDFYSVPRYRDEDYRPLLAYVRTHSTRDDVILASYQWQLGLYQAYLPPPHPRFYVVPGWGEDWARDPVRMQADLETLVGAHPRLWFPAYQSLGRLWETQVEGILNRIAYPTQVDWNLPGTKLTLYGSGDEMTRVTPTFVTAGQPGTAVVPPDIRGADFAGQVMLDEVRVGNRPVEAGRGIVPVALTWHRLSSVDTDYRVALDMVDAAGQGWAGRDSLPQGGLGSFAALAPGQAMLDHHGVLVPAGTPPGTYQLRLSVVDTRDGRPLDVLDAQGQPRGTAASLGSLTVIPPAVPLAAEALPIQHPLRADFTGGVRLLGYSLGDTPASAGEALSFSLFWQALADQHTPYVVFAQMQDAAGRPLALSESPPACPTDGWQAGMLLRDPRQIPLPPELPAGEYRLAVGLLQPDGARLTASGGSLQSVPAGSLAGLLWGRADQVILARVLTTQRAHRFDPPTPVEPWYAADARFGDHARLVGYQIDTSQPITPGGVLRLVLHWQAQQPFPHRYTVFVHLVDANDRIAGQRDQEPGGGRFPTTGWVNGEYLEDDYAVPVNPETPPGTYYIELGLYDPRDGARLPVSDAQGTAPDSRLLLRATPIQVR